MADEPLEILVRDIILCFSVVLELLDLFHGILAQKIVTIQPVEKHAQIAYVIVDGGDGHRCAEIAAALRIIGFLLLAADWVLYILDILDIIVYNRTAERLLCAVYCFGFGFAELFGKKGIWYTITAYSIFRCLLHWLLYFL